MAALVAIRASFDASSRPSRLVVRQAADMVGGSLLGLRAWSYIVVGSIDSCEVFSQPAAQSERTNNAAHAYRHRRNRRANSDRVRSVDAHCRRPHIALEMCRYRSLKSLRNPSGPCTRAWRSEHGSSEAGLAIAGATLLRPGTGASKSHASSVP